MGHIWDPRIHERFHESFVCAFITLARPERGRLRNGNNVYEQFCEELHTALGKEGVTTYSLFGRYDVFLQSWCDEDKAYRLYTHITTSDLVRQSVFYAYRQIIHLWAEAAQKRTFNELELHKINEPFVRGVQRGDRDTSAEALKARFLLPRPERQANQSWLKFFTLMPLLTPVRNDPEERKKADDHFWPHVIDGIKGAQVQIEQVNELTVGLIGEMPKPRGQGDIAAPSFIGGVIIEGRVAAAHLDKILPFGFLAARADHQLRGGSETYIVATAENDWRESDEITSFGETVGTEQLRKLESLFRLNADDIIRLDSRRCAWVLQQTTKHKELIDLERIALSKSVLLAWLRAYLCDDNEQAFRTLSVLMKVEGSLALATKKLLSAKSSKPLEVELLPQLFDKELKTCDAAGNVVIVEQAKNGPEAKIGKISKFTLADWINILDRVNLGKLSPNDKGTIEGLCGDAAALDTLREMIQVSSTTNRGWRNMYAHGDLNRPLPQKRVMDDQMQRLTDFLVRLAWIVRHLDGNEAEAPSSVPAKVPQ